MPRALSQLRDTVLVACLAALACLPPAGWQLCVGAEGHWALEPAALAADACCGDEPGAPAPGASATDDCADCTDHSLAGQATVGGRSGDAGLAASAAPAFVSPPAALPAPDGARPAAVTARARSKLVEATLRSTVLRL